MECKAINECEYIKKLQITATPKIVDERNEKYGTWAGKIAIWIIFHFSGKKDITLVSGIGHLPVLYGTALK